MTIYRGHGLAVESITRTCVVEKTGRHIRLNTKHFSILAALLDNGSPMGTAELRRSANFLMFQYDKPSEFDRPIKRRLRPIGTLGMGQCIRSINEKLIGQSVKIKSSGLALRPVYELLEG